MREMLRLNAEAARCLREGLHIEFGCASEKLASLAEPPGERPFDVYREWLTRQDEARALLEQIGGESADSSAVIEIDLAAHRPIVLCALNGQLRACIEVLGETDDAEKRALVNRIRIIEGAIRAIPGPAGPS